MLFESLKPEILEKIAPRRRLGAKVIRRLQRYEQQPDRVGLHDEQVWTLLFVYGFAACESRKGLTAFSRSMTRDKERVPGEAWLEMLPLPPRQGTYGESEGNSEIDLALGHLVRRGASVSGITYQSPRDEDGWVCLTEAKWLGDIACMTTHDRQRNQLIRVIETALTFQGNGQMPKRIHVTLLTPELFKPATRNDSASRLYAYKWREYTTEDESVNPDAILIDIDRCLIARRRNVENWQYPNLRDRLKALQLHWVTYEQLFSVMPDSAFRCQLQQFIAAEHRPLLQLQGEA